MVALTVFVPQLAWIVFDTYVLAHPDSKFGASGGILFAAFVFGIATVIAGAVGAILVQLRRTTPYRVHKLSALVAGLILSSGSHWIPNLAVYGVGQAIFGEVVMIMVNWAIVCVVALLLTQLAAGRIIQRNCRI